MKIKTKKQAGLLIVPFNINFKNLMGVKNDETCLVMSYLEMLFEDQPNGFMKFIRDCENQETLAGNSFTRELRMKERTFRESFKNIGIAYRSKQQFSRARDKFQGKYYCSITDPINDNRTLYLRNHALMNIVLTAINFTSRKGI